MDGAAVGPPSAVASSVGGSAWSNGCSLPATTHRSVGSYPFPCVRALTLSGGCRSGEPRDLAAQLGQPEPDPALGRPQRDALAAGDLLGGHAAPVGEHERLALGGGQLAQ